MSRSTELVRSGMAGEFTDTEHAIKIIKELEAKLANFESDAYVLSLLAKLDAVKEVESYSIELQDIGEPATVMLTKDVLKAIGEQG